jgi:hypothetical protein
MALSAPAPRKADESISIAYYPVAASAICYQGGLAVLNATGYVQPGTAATSLTAVGIFDHSGDVLNGVVDNTGGADGAVNARVRQGIFCFVNRSDDLVVEADVGQFCYIYDDTTVCHTGTSKSVAGLVRRVDAQGVWVQIGAAFGTALAAEISSRQAISTALALTSTPGGASLVGIWDTAAKISATTVEGALAENIDARRIALGTDGNTLPVPQVMISKTIANSAGDTDVTLNATYGGIRVTNVIVEKAAASSTGGDATITVKNTATAITEVMALSGLTAGLVYRNTTIVPTAASIASGGILRITAAKSTGDCACTVTVYGYRVA